MGADGEVKVVITGEETVTPAAQKTTAALGELGGETKKTAKAAEELNLKSRETRLLFSEMNQIAPGLGHQLHAAFAGPLGPVILLAIAIAEVHGKLKEFNKELDEAGKAAAEGDFLGNMESKLEVLRNAFDAAQSYADKLNEIATGEDKVSTALKKQLELDKAIERAQAESESAEKGLAIAKVQAAEASGQLTPEKAAGARAAIEKQFIAQQEADKEAAQQKELDRQQKALETAEANAAKLHQDEQAASKTVTDDEAHRAAVKLNPEDQLKKINDAISHLDEMQTILDKVRNGTATSGEAGRAKAIVDSGQMENQRIAIANLEKELQQYNQSLATPVQAEKDAEAEAKKHETENTTAIKSLTESIEQLKTIIAATTPIDQQTAAAKSGTVDLNESARLSKDFMANARTIHAFDMAKNSSAELISKAAQAIRDMESVMKDHKDLLVNIVGLAGIIRELQTAQKDLAKRTPPN